MQDFNKKLKEFMSWVGEKTWRVLVATLIFVFVVIPALILLVIYMFYGGMSRNSVSAPAVYDGVVSFYGKGGGVAMGMERAVSYDYVGKTGGTSVIYQANSSTPNLPFDKKVIKNGSLDLIVKKTETAIAQIESIAKTFEGFVENANVYEVSDGNKSGSMTIRVPSKNFSDALSSIKSVAIKVGSESVSSSDVTAQYVDLEAEIKNYKAEEKQYREIMEKAVKIEDVLNVAGRLAEVRGKIDRAEAQLNYLGRQVDMSTINISLTGEAEVKVFGIVWRPLTVLKQSVKGMFSDLTSFVDWLIGFIFRLPILVLKLAFWVLVAFVVVKVFKKVIRYFFK